jgi:hypothetical protein
MELTSDSAFSLFEISELSVSVLFFGLGRFRSHSE